jgi:hypothetical protein
VSPFERSQLVLAQGRIAVGVQPFPRILRPRHSCIHAHQNLPEPDVLAAEIVEDLEAALEQFREIAGDLGSSESKAGAE